MKDIYYWDRDTLIISAGVIAAIVCILIIFLHMLYENGQRRNRRIAYCQDRGAKYIGKDQDGFESCQSKSGPVYVIPYNEAK